MNGTNYENGKKDVVLSVENGIRFVDVGSIHIGGQMEFLGTDGRWYRTSRILRYLVAGGGVIVETLNSVYHSPW